MTAQPREVSKSKDVFFVYTTLFVIQLNDVEINPLAQLMFGKESRKFNLKTI